MQRVFPFRPVLLSDNPQDGQLYEGMRAFRGAWEATGVRMCAKVGRFMGHPQPYGV